MACKISDQSTAVQAVTWPSRSSPKAPEPKRPMPAGNPAPAELIPRAPAPDLEKMHQAELSKTRQAGFAEGVKKGYEDAASEINKANERLAQTLRDLAGLKKKIRSEAEADVVKLSIAIARRILHRELNADPDSLRGLVYAGLQKLQNREISQVRVAPDAYDTVRDALEKAAAFPAITITRDPRMASGGILFETVLGDLDASVETQLQEIERGFADRLRIA